MSFGAAVGSCIPPELGYEPADGAAGATGGAGAVGRSGGEGGSPAGGTSGGGSSGGGTAGSSAAGGADASTGGAGVDAASEGGGRAGGGGDAAFGGGGGGAIGGDDGGSGAGGCPVGLPGPALVEVFSVSGSYCIDATEVTNAQYAQFLAALPPTSGQVPGCSWNADLTPSDDWPATGREDHPVAFVDWCDAAAYCLWANKRLCGRIGGGPNDPADFTDAAQSQWFNACSNGATTTFPYGSVYDGAKCNTDDHPGTSTIPVGSAIECRSQQVAAYDLSGNVYEWEDSCTGNAGSSDICHARGGSYDSVAVLARCDYEGRFYRNAIGVVGPYLGFRCCGP